MLTACFSSALNSMSLLLQSCPCLDSGHKRSGGRILDLWESLSRSSPLPATWRYTSGSLRSGENGYPSEAMSIYYACSFLPLQLLYILHFRLLFFISYAMPSSPNGSNLPRLAAKPPCPSGVVLEPASPTVYCCSCRGWGWVDPTDRRHKTGR